jgi:hypothetical protein
MANERSAAFTGVISVLLPWLYLARSELRMRFGPDAGHGRFRCRQ